MDLVSRLTEHNLRMRVPRDSGYTLPVFVNQVFVSLFITEREVGRLGW